MSKKNDENQKLKISEYSISTLKGMIGAIPFAGTFINEVAFEARSRLKQNRVNSFIKEFAEYIETIEYNSTNIENISKEDFGDIFEEIILSVTKTSVKHKIEIFKKILLGELICSTDEKDLILKFIEITNRLSKIQFKILSDFSKISDRVLNYKSELFQLQEILAQTKEAISKEILIAGKGYESMHVFLHKRIKTTEQRIKKRQKAIRDFDHLNVNLHTTYNIDRNNYLTEMNDLVSRGLMYDQAIKSDNINMNNEFGITSLGRRYIEYINQVDKEKTLHNNV